MAKTEVTINELDSTAGAIAGAWKSWTPTWSAGLTVGNGTVVAKYVQIGKTVHVRFAFKFGSTSSTNALITFTLPVTPNSEYASMIYGAGIVLFQDEGGNSWIGTVRIRTDDKADIVVGKTDGTYNTVAGTTNTVPFTWGNTDYFAGTFTYEAA